MKRNSLFLSIASPNNLTPTSEKPLLYYGLMVSGMRKSKGLLSMIVVEYRK
ncbi:unnamed protein product [Brassica napus]|uniref:(rape) hypothetical protein n=1 Tax=Brassica napus TaxID=3708 RepID=A0A816QX87_BRANA|nr:unnamed protein product [Brassica napus]